MVRVDFMVMFDQLRSEADDFLIHMTKYGYQGLKPRQIYTIADNLLSLIFFCPLVVLFCQCTDAILDVLLCNHFPTLGPWLVMLFGITVEFGCSFYQSFVSQTIFGDAKSEFGNHVVNNNAHSKGNDGKPEMDKPRREIEVFQVISSRTFNYVIAIANVCHYRGLYDIFVSIEGYGVRAGTAAALTGIVGLWGLRASRNIMASPLYLSTDNSHPKKFFKVDTLLNYPTDCSLDSFLDHVITIGVMQSLVHMHWTGVWLLLDAVTLSTYIPAISSVICLLIGYSVTCFLIITQRHAQSISSNLDGDEEKSKKIVFEDLYLLVANVATILIWKGLWMSLEIYEAYFPVLYHGFDITIWLGHFCSFLIIAMAQASNTLAGSKYCERDGQFFQGAGVTFGTCYFRELIGDVDSIWPKRTNDDSTTTDEDITPSEVAMRKVELNGGSHISKRIAKGNRLSGALSAADEEETKSLNYDMKGSSSGLSRESDDSWYERRASESRAKAK